MQRLVVEEDVLSTLQERRMWAATEFVVPFATELVTENIWLEHVPTRSRCSVEVLTTIIFHCEGRVGVGNGNGGRIITSVVSFTMSVGHHEFGEVSTGPNQLVHPIRLQRVDVVGIPLQPRFRVTRARSSLVRAGYPQVERLTDHPVVVGRSQLLLFLQRNTYWPVAEQVLVAEPTHASQRAAVQVSLRRISTFSAVRRPEDVVRSAHEISSGRGVHAPVRVCVHDAAPLFVHRVRTVFVDG